MRPALTPSLSLAGLTGAEGLAAGDPRALLDFTVRLGYQAVQLDAAAEGLRPRDLDRSARRDLAAVLRRSGLSCSGLDLWIPAAHFADPVRVDRAVAAVVQAIILAAELSSLPGEVGAGRVVSVTFPKETPAGVLDQISQSGQLHGVVIADHAWPARAVTAADSALATGLDPAAVILAGQDPAKEVSRLVAPPASARLSDLSSAGRVPPGEGALDELAYTVALEVSGYRRALVVDVRGLPRPAQAARDIVQRWTGFGVAG